MIRRFLREIGRAPLRIMASVIALALAVGAIGVFAIPTVSTSSLRDAAERDGVPDVVLTTTDTGAIASSEVERRLAALPDVEVVESQVVHVAAFGADGAGGADWSVEVVGLPAGRTMDRVTLESGRFPTAPGEVVATPGTTDIGDALTVDLVDGTTANAVVVGIGSTSFWTDAGAVFTDVETARAVSGVDGANRIVLRTSSADAATLGRVADEARAVLASAGISLTGLPIEVVDGRHPIEVEIEQISMLIGLLGIVAGVVGLVLLASTTNTLVVERSREVAVMRALGATDRAVRRRLRRIALSMAAAATVLGIPLGIAISYVIARMVLQEFLGLTPGFAVSPPVIAGSAAFALVGARLVAARSARRVTRRPLAETLRDRDVTPFGGRAVERAAVGWSGGRLLDRLALRNGLRNSGRSTAITLQLAAAVSALLVVASMATTITAFNAAELDPIRWRSTTWVAGPGLDIPADVADDAPGEETGVEVVGEVAGWEVDVLGWIPETQMIDRTVTAGRWFDGSDDAVVSAGFARRVGLVIGDDVQVELASGVASFEIVGLHGNRGREVYLDRDALAAVLGGDGLANRLYSLDTAPSTELLGVTGTERFDVLSGDDTGRTAILTIFGAVGVVVVAVAGLAVMSGLAVTLHERRRELAAMRAIGARRRDLLGALFTEVAGLAVLGFGIGIVGGYLGGRWITRSFEESNAVDIGFTFADRALPSVGLTTVFLVAGVTAFMLRRVVRRPAAVTLRGA
ncbi:MAG: FtsX-like permease family protein [Actinomycetota bacterium]